MDKTKAGDVVLVMGPAGVGKSTFINRAAGKRVLDDSSSLSHHSGISSVYCPYRCVDENSRVWFVEIPAFTEDPKSKPDIEKEIQKFLKKKNRETASGIIYILRISDVRLTDPPTNHFKTFERFCGDSYQSKIILTTSMWNETHGTDANAREDEMRTFWKPMIDGGSQLTRFENTSESAWHIVDCLLQNHGNGDLKCGEVQIKDISSQDIIIALMGPTGSGKSHFIEVVTGQKEDSSGHSLQSCTASVRAVRVNVNNSPFVFVDTPGFDDTRRSDTDVLKMIANWLQNTYKDDIRLAGIIYLHRITDNRMAGAPAKNLRMFGNLCGDDAVQNVVFATTMWSNVRPYVGEAREKELMQTFWKSMVDLGASSLRFLDTYESGWMIINAILQKSAPSALLLQEEMVDLRKHLCETQAGITLYNSLQGLLTEQREVEYLLRNQGKMQDFQKMEELEGKLRRTLDQLQQMKVPIGRRVLNTFSFRRSHAVSHHSSE